MRVRSDAGPDASNQNSPAMVRLLRIKLAAAVFEFSDRRHAHGAVVAACEILAPLVGFRIVQKQSQTFEVTPRAIGLNLLQLSAAIPNFPNHDSAVEFDPRGACSRLPEVSNVSLPSAKIEVKNRGSHLAVRRPVATVYRMRLGQLVGMTDPGARQVRTPRVKWPRAYAGS
jgi:hypothetical protein